MVKANQNERRVGVFTCTGNFKYINMFFCVITPSGFKSYIYIYIYSSKHSSWHIRSVSVCHIRYSIHSCDHVICKLELNLFAWVYLVNKASCWACLSWLSEAEDIPQHVWLEVLEFGILSNQPSFPSVEEIPLCHNRQKVSSVNGNSWH